MPFPPYPSTPSPFTWTKGQPVWAPWLRSDVVNAVLLLTQPPVFSGSQTGVPASFTAIAGTSFTAPATAYVTGQPIVFSGGSIPSGITAGQVYYVFNPVAGTFGITLTAGGSVYTGYGSGHGTVATTQLITQSAWTGVSLDTEPGAGDAWNGHQTTTNPAYWYGMFPGYYLAEFTFPCAYTGGGGTGVSAGLLTQEGTGPQQVVGGQCGRISGTAGRYAQVSVTRLLALSVTGTYAGPGNNYAAAAAWQDNASPITPLAAPTRYAQMNTEWLAALSGTPCQVPDNDTWPAPPLPVGATFVNKNIRDTIGFLAFRPVMEAYWTGAYALASGSNLPGTGSTIPCNHVQADNWGAFSAASGVWTAPVPGLYDVYAQVAVSAASTSNGVAAGFTMTSANYNSGTTFTVWGPPQGALTGAGEVNCAVMRRRVRLNAGDFLTLAGFQNDSGSNPATLSYGTWKSRLITVWRAK